MIDSALSGATPSEAYEKGLPPQLQPKRHRLFGPLPDQSEHKAMINRTSGRMIGRPEYTLTLPPSCPRKWDHLTDTIRGPLCVRPGDSHERQVVQETSKLARKCRTIPPCPDWHIGGRS